MIALLLAGHLIGDWIAQTDWQAANKGRSWRAMAAHMLGYHVALAACLVWVLGGWALAVVLAVSLCSHAFIDRRWPVVWLMAHTGSEPFSRATWGVLVVDQALHLTILLLVAQAVAT